MGPFLFVERYTAAGVSYPGRDTAWCPRISTFKVHFSYALYCEAECFKNHVSFACGQIGEKLASTLTAIRLRTPLHRGDLYAPFCKLNQLPDRPGSSNLLRFFAFSTYFSRRSSRYFDFFVTTDLKLEVFFLYF